MEPQVDTDGLSKKLNKLLEAMKTVIVGQDEILKKLIIAMIAEGHVLIEGVPGLAKTKIMKNLAACFELKFGRIQFTPDILPSDLTGSDVISIEKNTPDTKEGHETKKEKEETEKEKKNPFNFIPGPILESEILLADEINRAPPKVQSALLEAMEEKTVTVNNIRRETLKPFIVCATLNPIESEGVYPLPESQSDRFMLKLVIDYLKDTEEEIKVIHLYTQQEDPEIKEIIIKKTELIDIQKAVKKVYVSYPIKKYVAEIARLSRYKYYTQKLPSEENRDFHENLSQEEKILFGASTRAAIHLIKVAKVSAFLNNRDYVDIEDIIFIAYDVLRHRIILDEAGENPNTIIEGIIKKILQKVILKHEPQKKNPK